MIQQNKFKEDNSNYELAMSMLPTNPSVSTELLDKLAEKDSNNDSLWLMKGNAYFNEGKYDKAVSSFEKVIEINPLAITFDVFPLMYGEAHLYNGNQEKAELLFKHAQDMELSGDMLERLNYNLKQLEKK
jgi:tetratricopeptide (TPR) repeat protein